MALAIGVTALWVFGYVYINLLACAYQTNPPPGGCGIEMPWRLRGEDAIFLLVIPGAITSVFWALAIYVWRRRKRLERSSNSD